MIVPNILVIEDNIADIELLRLALDRQGEKYELQVLNSGDDAIRFIQEQGTGLLEEPEKPCVILLDLHLPKYDGIAILRAIREAPELAHVHVIVLSGAASPLEQREIAHMGAHYRKKPFGIKQFFELGAEILAICGSATVVAA